MRDGLRMNKGVFTILPYKKNTLSSSPYQSAVLPRGGSRNTARTTMGETAPSSNHYNISSYSNKKSRVNRYDEFHLMGLILL